MFEFNFIKWGGRVKFNLVVMKRMDIGRGVDGDIRGREFNLYN